MFTAREQSIYHFMLGAYCTALVEQRRRRWHPARTGVSTIIERRPRSRGRISIEVEARKSRVDGRGVQWRLIVIDLHKQFRSPGAVDCLRKSLETYKYLFGDLPRFLRNKAIDRKPNIFDRSEARWKCILWEWKFNVKYVKIISRSSQAEHVKKSKRL